MKKMNSQICTTIEQSQCLLDLGLKPETADMSYYILDDEPVLTIGMAQVYREILKGGKIVKKQNAEIIPSWSLHRLMEIYLSHFGNSSLIFRNGQNPYDLLISNIEQIISDGYFNKEYLKQ